MEDILTLSVYRISTIRTLSHDESKIWATRKNLDHNLITILALTTQYGFYLYCICLVLITEMLRLTTDSAILFPLECRFRFRCRISDILYWLHDISLALKYWLILRLLIFIVPLILVVLL